MGKDGGGGRNSSLAATCWKMEVSIALSHALQKLCPTISNDSGMYPAPTSQASGEGPGSSLPWSYVGYSPGGVGNTLAN